MVVNNVFAPLKSLLLIYTLNFHQTPFCALHTWLIQCKLGQLPQLQFNDPHPVAPNFISLLLFVCPRTKVGISFAGKQIFWQIYEYHILSSNSSEYLSDQYCYHVKITHRGHQLAINWCATCRISTQTTQPRLKQPYLYMACTQQIVQLVQFWLYHLSHVHMYQLDLLLCETKSIHTCLIGQTKRNKEKQRSRMNKATRFIKLQLRQAILGSNNLVCSKRNTV